MKKGAFGLLIVVFWCALGVTANFSGSYKMVSGNVQLFLVLQQQGSKLSGGLTGTTGADLKLQGNVEGEYAAGKCIGNNLQVFFNLYFEGSELYVQLIEPDANGQPDWTKLRELVFKKTGSVTNVAPRKNYTPKQNHGGSNPLAKKANSAFNGKYSGDGLTLNLKRSGRNVQGTMVFGGNKFKLNGKVSGNNLSGNFSSNGDSFSFNASIRGRNLTFETAGTTYRLKGSSSSNPLAKKSNPLAKGNSTRSSHSASASASYANSNSNSGSNSRIKVDSMGLSFVAPSGWALSNNKNAEGYMLVSKTIPGVIIIIPHSYTSLQELVNSSAEGFVENGVELYPVGQTQTISNNSAGTEFSGTYNGVQAKAYVVGAVSPNGGGLLALCLTTTEKYSDVHKRSAISLVKSVRFYKPKVDTALMNALAYNYYSFTGSTERTLTLCASGIFYDSSESSYSGKLSGGGNWGTAGNDSGSGRWKAVGNEKIGVIYFQYNSGQEFEKKYQAGYDAFYLGGVKYGYKGKANCR